MTEPVRDWRGTPIEVGATVIYGAGVGSHSIGLVEATVDGFTDSGRVWLNVIRRAASYAWTDSKPRVHVGPDRLTVVTELPPSDAPTEADKIAKAQKRAEDYQRRLATHDWPPRDPNTLWKTMKCNRCGATSGQTVCPG